METAMILEGGGMRGLYTAGVLDLLLDKGVRIPRVYGVSAGACHACSYLSGQRERAKRTVTDFLRDPRYAGAGSFLRTGDFFGVGMIYDEIPNRLLPYDYDAFARGNPEFAAVVTNCATGRPEYPRIRDLRRDTVWIRASSSLPLLSRMVEVDGSKYLDGGVSDSIPLGRSLADGNRRNLVVLTQHRGYRKQPSGARKLMKARYRKYPRLVECMERRHEQYNASLDLVRREEEAGRAFVIRPRLPVTIGRLEKDLDKLEALYRTGYREAEVCFERLQAFLSAGGTLHRAV